MSEESRELSKGWCRDAEGALRRETIHSMLRRMVGWDYRQRAIYEITVVLADRASQALGRLEVQCSPTLSASVSGEGAWVSIDEARRAATVDSATLSPSTAHPSTVLARVVPSALGAAVARCWEAIPKFYPQIKILAKQVMPDHFHGVLFVTEPLGCHLGQVIKGFKTGCNKAARALGVLNSATVSPRTVLSPRTGPGLFAEGFNDSILFREGQLGNWFHYLADNPRRLALKLLYPGLFRNVRELAVRVSGEVRRVLGDTVAEYDTPEHGTPEHGTSEHGTSEHGTSEHGTPEHEALAHFSALGNLFLLDRPLAQVQVSRRDFGYKREPRPGGPPSRGYGAASGLKICRDENGEPIVGFTTPLYAEKREALFAAAKHGAVLISPCVSDGERQIAREALAAGLKLIALKNKGFSPLQKPSGRAFDACVEGRLLMLAPSAWPYVPGEKVMTRFDAVAMNRLCQWIAGPGAAEINYHGMKPVNIDALACAAARVSCSATLSPRVSCSAALSPRVSCSAALSPRVSCSAALSPRVSCSATLSPRIELESKYGQ